MLPQLPPIDRQQHAVPPDIKKYVLTAMILLIGTIAIGCLIVIAVIRYAFVIAVQRRTRVWLSRRCIVVTG